MCYLYINTTDTKLGRKVCMRQQKVVSILSSFSDLVGYLITYFMVDLILVLLFAVILPSYVALGTDLISPLRGLVQASFLLSFFVISTVPLIEQLVSQMKLELSDRDWFAVFAVVNSAMIWLVARFAVVVGMGISSWRVALMLGVIFSIVQGWSVKNLLRGE